MRRVFALLLVLLPLPVAALEVRVHPGEIVYAYEVDPARGLYDIMLHNIAVVQKEGSPVTVDSVEVQAISNGQAVQTLLVPAADLEKSAQRLSAMEAQGFVKLYDFHFQTSRYLAGLRLSATRTLEPGTALVVSGKPLLLAGLPSNGLAIVAHAKDAGGKAVEARTTLRVENHRSPNEYLFPLAGTWYIGAAPNLHSHHRWAAMEEFAFDIVALGGEGRRTKGTAAGSTTITATAGTSSRSPTARSSRSRRSRPKPTTGCGAPARASRATSSGPCRRRPSSSRRAPRR
jgi:hypothetical protein